MISSMLFVSQHLHDLFFTCLLCTDGLAELARHWLSRSILPVCPTRGGLFGCFDAREATRDNRGRASHVRPTKLRQPVCISCVLHTDCRLDDWRWHRQQTFPTCGSPYDSQIATECSILWWLGCRHSPHRRHPSPNVGLLPSVGRTII